MFTVYEYAGPLLLLVAGATLLFVAGVAVLVLIEGAGRLAHALRKIQRGGHSAAWKMVDQPSPEEIKSRFDFLQEGRGWQRSYPTWEHASEKFVVRARWISR